MADVEPLALRTARRRGPGVPWTAAICVAALLAAGTALGVTGLSIPDLREIERENAHLERLIEEIDSGQVRRDTEHSALAARLANDELTLYGDDISAEVLRQARLALDSVQSRTAVIQGRIEQRTLSLKRLEKQIEQLDRAIAGSTADGLEARVDDLRNEVARDLLTTQARLTGQIIDSYRGALRANRRYVELLQDHLRLLQSRLRLSDLESAGLFVEDARVPLLEAVIAEHLRRAARLANEVAEADGDEPTQKARRHALNLRVDDAVTRSFLRQNDLELILAGNALKDLRALRRDELMPLHVLRGAERRVAEVDANLVQVAAALTAQLDVLRSRRAALTRHTGEAPPELVLLDDLETAIGFQQADIERLRQQATEEREAYARVIGERYAGALGERRPLPDTTAEWRRLADNARHLPRLLGHGLDFVRDEVRGGATAAGPGRNSAVAAAGLVLLALVVWGRRLLRRWCAAQPADSRLAEFARPLARVLPALLPALLWLLLALAYSLPGTAMLPILLLLILPPLLAFVLALARELLYAAPMQRGALAADEAQTAGSAARLADGTQAVAATTPAATPDTSDDMADDRGAAPAATDSRYADMRSRKGFYRKLRLGLLLAAVVAALYILTRSLPVAPILADLLDRLAMLSVLALALPAFALHDLFRGFAARAERRHRLVPATVASLSRLLPLFLLAVGLIGLMGYINLAWALLTYLAWAVVVALLLAFVLGLLADLRDRAVERLTPEPMPAAAATPADVDDLEDDYHIETKTATAEVSGQAPTDSDDALPAAPAPVTAADDLGDFWRTHFVEPGYRLGALLSVLGAGWLLFSLWGWHKDTPMLRGLLALIGTPLFKLGESAFTIADIVLAVVLVGSVFYIGGWSQQVSYNLAYRRVRDAGLRQALATFTQYVVIVAGVLLALKIIGFDLTTLTVFAASLGVGIGFGLQNIINNFVSGILLLAERPLKVGDFVSIGSNLGSVTRIGIRSLTMRTLDKQEVIIPNGSVISGEFTNWTRSDDLLRNVHYIRIRYEDDTELAIRLIERILRRHPHVLEDPSPGVFLWEYSESSVDLRVQYCFRMNEGPGGLVIRSEVLLEIGRAFRRHGLRMPHAQRDVTMHLDEDSRGLLASLGGSRPPAL
jgi:potassium efflux system protein